jgi:hypothetical protein
LNFLLFKNLKIFKVKLKVIRLPYKRGNFNTPIIKQNNMTAQILKTVLAGILAGVLIFMVPFIIVKILLFFLILRAIFGLLGGRRRYWHRHPACLPAGAGARKYHNMSEEERKAFHEKYGKYGYSRGCYYPEENKENDSDNQQDKQA